MGKFFAAIRFLTICPIPGEVGVGQEELTGSLPYFPVVGLLVGGLLALCAKFLLPYLPASLLAVVMVFGLLAVSGGFHLDGLADSADGFFSSRPRDRMLEIMRDSHTGVMGVIAVVIVILLKVAALANMPSERFVMALFIMPLAGRSLMVMKMALLSYVRKQEGVASLFYTGSATIKKTAFWSLTVLYCGAWYGGGLAGLAAVGSALLAVLGFSLYCKIKIGGATGDTLGASCELAETAVAVALAVSLS